MGGVFDTHREWPSACAHGCGELWEAGAMGRRTAARRTKEVRGEGRPWPIGRREAAGPQLGLGRANGRPCVVLQLVSAPRS